MFIQKMPKMLFIVFVALHADINSIQFRHLYAPANKHHVGAHGEKKATIIKYMNGQRKKNQSTLNKWDFSFVLNEWSDSPGSRKSTGSEFRTADEA